MAWAGVAWAGMSWTPSNELHVPKRGARKSAPRGAAKRVFEEAQDETAKIKGQVPKGVPPGSAKRSAFLEGQARVRALEI